ncbi:hypothetical protein JOL62DRAFT_568880 [Phyllosticta paracitricarpa]|uniref:Secreted protein n=1 Tax=Phyllosticta paracitricarpa TaxID=2016321 RepID=A0ABR1ND00_9PEZI
MRSGGGRTGGISLPSFFFLILLLLLILHPLAPCAVRSAPPHPSPRLGNRGPHAARLLGKRKKQRKKEKKKASQIGGCGEQAPKAEMSERRAEKQRKRRIDLCATPRHAMLHAHGART